MEEKKLSPVEAGRAALRDLKEICANGEAYSKKLLETIIRDNENTE
jgi:hypothetical protein